MKTQTRRRYEVITRKRSARLLVGLVTLAAALGLAACGSDDESGDDGGSGEGGKIGFLLPGDADGAL